MKIQDDLIRAAEVDANLYDRVISLLALSRDDDDESEVEIGRLYEDDENVRSLLDFVFFMTNTLLGARDFRQELVEFEETITRLTENNDQANKSWKRIRGSLESLTPFLLYRKEQDLKDRFKRIEHFAITTNVRPVFTLDKSQIHKNLYVGIVRVRTSDEKDFICEIYDDKLESFFDELSLAKKKFDVIRERFG